MQITQLFQALKNMCFIAGITSLYNTLIMGGAVFGAIPCSKMLFHSLSYPLRKEFISFNTFFGFSIATAWPSLFITTLTALGIAPAISS